MIEKDSIKEAIGADLPIQVPCAVVIALVVVNLDDLAVGKVQGILQVDYLL